MSAEEGYRMDVSQSLSELSVSGVKCHGGESYATFMQPEGRQAQPIFRKRGTHVSRV